MAALLTTVSFMLPLMVGLAFNTSVIQSIPTWAAGQTAKPDLTALSQGSAPLVLLMLVVGALGWLPVHGAWSGADRLRASRLRGG